MKRELTEAEVKALAKLSYKKSTYKRKKKIKDLTQEEMSKICAAQTKGYILCENTKCPLFFAGSCLKGFIERLQYIESEVEVDE